MKRSLTQKPVKKNRMILAVMMVGMMMVVRMTQVVMMVVRMTQVEMTVGMRIVDRMTQEIPEAMTVQVEMRVLTLEILAQKPKPKLK